MKRKLTLILAAAMILSLLALCGCGGGGAAGGGNEGGDLIPTVLGKVKSEDRAAYTEALGRAADAAKTIVTDGVQTAMNRYNAKRQDHA